LDNLTTLKVEIRPANENDLFAFAGDPDTSGLLSDRLRRRAEKRPLRLRNAIGRRSVALVSKGELLVAFADGEVVGHVYIWDQPADERVLRRRCRNTPLIMNLWVRPDCRRDGIGSLLMDDAENWLRRRGHRSVALGVDPDNTVAIKLYRGRGYTGMRHAHIRTHRDHFRKDGSSFRTWETCAILRKELRPMRAAGGGGPHRQPA
jgi:ribosomal protein S18 acetylase RimI-like enzyme